MSAAFSTLGFSPLARAVAAFLDGLGGSGPAAAEGGPALGAAAALVVRAVERGDTCLDLRAVGGRTLGELLGDDCGLGREGERLPEAGEWERALRAVGPDVVGTPGAWSPLVLDEGGRLYLHRYWGHEQAVAAGIRARIAPRVPEAELGFLRESIARLFDPGAESPDWQRVAAATAALRRVAVVSGGPGTGKTYTLVRILAILAEQGLRNGLRPAMALAAPTGKAAARLTQAVREARESLRCSAEAMALIPAEASTLHRLLGAAAGARAGPRGGGDAPRLPFDVVVVDECSMTDVSLMARLFALLRPEARLILAGDKDQLSSVEAGVVMGDICDTGREHGSPPWAAEEVLAASGEAIPAAMIRPEEPAMASCLALLRRNHRMREDGPIALVARACNRGDSEAVLRALSPSSDAEVRLVRTGSPGELHAALCDEALPWFREYTSAASPEAGFRAFGRRVILCAVRRGPTGVEGVNAAISDALERSGATRGRRGRVYPGLPIIVGVNDYALRLFNGDIGIVAPPEGHGPDGTEGPLACLFPRPEGGVRRVSTVRLPPHDPAFALTVHKSQGSEFDDVSLVLPTSPGPVLSRELLYTAVTRARRRLTVYGTEEVVRWMVEHPTIRRSGLRDLLWKA